MDHESNFDMLDLSLAQAHAWLLSLYNRAISMQIGAIKIYKDQTVL